MPVQHELASLQAAWQFCLKRRWRLPLWMQVCAAQLPSVMQQQVPALLQQRQQDLPATRLELRWLGAATHHFVDCTAALGPRWHCSQLQGQARQQMLGRECDVLIIDTTAGIDWDLVAASCGTLKAGGLWLLITRSDVDTQPNPLAKKVLSWPTDAQHHVGCFQRFFCNQLQQTPLWQWIQTSESTRITPNSAWIDWQHRNGDCLEYTTAEAFPQHAQLQLQPCTAEQQDAIAAILRVVTGHRRRPLVLTAHRGRGKSASLGLAAAQLQLSGKHHILVTAPNPAAAQVVLSTAQAALGSIPSSVRFVPVDVLLTEQPACDLLLVDEAAAIPTPQLQHLTNLYSRLVFATTEHGYEGTGRGFQLRFQRYLQQHTPGWRQLHLLQPIRFARHDPLEQLSFQCFLLTPTLESVSPELVLSAARHIWLSREQLLANTSMLQDIFSLLTLAHYQTSVRDLWALLDDPSLNVAASYVDETLVAVALLSTEGHFPTPLASEISRGQRRVQGHLLAQSIAYHLLQPHLAEQSWWRVQRIVVQPTLQQQGVGSQLLQWLINQAASCQRGIGTSFGANAQLVNFWQRHGFNAVRLSAQPDQASAEYPLLMLHSSTGGSTADLQQLRDEFGIQLFHQLPYLTKLDPSLVSQWVRPQAPPLTAAQQRLLLAFANGDRPLHEVDVLLRLWLADAWLLLEQQTAQDLAAWIWLTPTRASEQPAPPNRIEQLRHAIQMTCIKS